MNIVDTFVANANKWLDVPFRYKGISKNGCDCVGLIIGVLSETEIISDEMIKRLKKIDYSIAIHNYAEIEKAFLTIESQLINLTNVKWNDVLKGDILCLKSKNLRYHFAICDNVDNVNKNNNINIVTIIHSTYEIGFVRKSYIDTQNYKIVSIMRFNNNLI